MAAPNHARLGPYEKGASGLISFAKIKELPSERAPGWLRGLDDRWRACTTSVSLAETRRAGYSLQVAVYCVNPAPDRPLLIFVHGILADHRSWRFVVGQLADECEVWLVDLPGCGESDAPHPKMIESDGYSASSMAERVAQAVEKRLQQGADSRPRRITLVGHSFGGMVCLRLLGDQKIKAGHPRLLEQIDRAVLMSTCEFNLNSVPSFFEPLIRLTGLKVKAGECLGVLDPKVRVLTRNRFFVEDCATKEEQLAFGHMLTDSRHRRAAQAMLLQTVPFDASTRRPNWPEIKPLMEDLARVDKPVLVIWGGWDEVLPCSMGHELKDHIPGAILVEIPERGHSLALEEPLGCALLIKQFVRGQPPNLGI